MRKENRYFVFDRPKALSLKNIVKLILWYIEGPIYKTILQIYHPSHQKRRYDVSICAIFKDEGKYLKEWIEYHRIVGVQHFYLYNNFSSDNYQEILQPYIDREIVTLKDWPIKQGQMQAYKDCVEQFGHEAQWIGFIDIDEFIVPNKTNTVGEFLKKFINRPIVIIYWRYFGSSGLMHRKENGLVTEDFIVASEKYGNIGKLFYNTDYDYADDLPKNQYMHVRWGRYKGIALPPVNLFDNVCLYDEHYAPSDEFPIQINHYLINVK